MVPPEIPLRFILGYNERGNSNYGSGFNNIPQEARVLCPDNWAKLIRLNLQPEIETPPTSQILHLESQTCHTRNMRGTSNYNELICGLLFRFIYGLTADQAALGSTRYVGGEICIRHNGLVENSWCNGLWMQHFHTQLRHSRIRISYVCGWPRSLRPCR